MTNPHLNRRSAIAVLTASVALPALSLPAVAQAAPVARLFVLSDLHSAYEHSAQLLAAITARIAADPSPAAILINGDVFELGNVVYARSGGLIDMEFLSRLTRLAPVVLNIGNHEPDLIHDIHEVVELMQAIGVTVVSNIIDTRSNSRYTLDATQLTLGPVRLSVVGIGTNALNTYPKPVRELISVPEAAPWAAENLGPLIAPGSIPVILSHAGVVQDRALLPLLPPGSLLIGGHDHLVLTHREEGKLYFHTGSWSNLYSVVSIAADHSMVLEQIALAADAPADPDLSALIQTTLDAHLTDEERTIIATIPAPLTLGETGRLTAEVMALATGSDIGFVGHTTFGTGLAAGPVSRYAFDAAVRFDGKLVVADVSPEVGLQLLARANQDGDTALADRTGDFLYAVPTDLSSKDKIRIVTGDWPAMNQLKYFGREDLVFEEIPDLKIKALVIQALQDG